MAVRRLEVEIVGNAKGAQKAFGDLEKASGRAGKKTESSLSKANKALIGFGAGAAIYGAFSAFDEAQKVTAQTEAVLKSTGNQAGVTSKEIEDLAGSLSKKSGVDDEAIQSGENLIATFTNIRNEAGKGNDVFTQTTKAALDMSVAMGTDMKSASMMLGKALNDPVAGLAKLTKVGVTFTAQQKDQIRALADSGDRLGAQKVILQEINKEFGGSAEAQATALGKAKVSVDNMAESVGGALAPALETAATSLGWLADGFSALPSGMQTGIIGLGLATAAAVKWHDAIGTGLSAMKTGATTISGFASALGGINTLAAERGLSRVDTLLNVLDAGGNKKTASTIRGVKGVTDALGGMAGVSAIGAGAIGGVSVALWKMQADSERAKNNMKSLAQQIELGMDPADAVAGKLTNTLAGLDGGFEGLSGSSKQFRKNLQEAGLTATEVAQIIAMPADEWERYSKELLNASGVNKHQASDMVSNLALMRDAQTGAIEADKIRTQVSGELGVKTDEVTAATQEGVTATQEATTAGKGLWGNNKDLIRSFQERVNEQTKINDGLQESIDLAYASVDANLALKSAHDSVQDAQLALAEARKSGNPEEVQRAEDALTSAILRESQASVEAARTSAEAQGKTLSAADAASIQQAKLAELAQQTGFTSDQIKWLAAQLDNAARERQIKLDTAQASADIDALVRKMMDAGLIGSGGVIGVGGDIVTAGVSGALGKLGPPRAQGGGVFAGGFNLVGEQGPEIVQWGASGTVIPAAKTKQILAGTSVNGGRSGGSGNVYNINVTEARDGKATARDVIAEINRQTRMGGRPLVDA